MNSICDHAKSCSISSCCEQAKEHVCCEEYGCFAGCNLITSAKCIPFIEVEEVATVEPARKPKRVRAFKEDIAAENVLLKMRVHQLECDLKRFVEMPTMRRIVWAVKGCVV